MCDSVMFCLSKGLGAPVGSMVVGTRAFIEKARVYRKMFGGGMRQAGVIAAAGLVALRNSPSRLHIDHENAQFLAKGVAAIPRLSIDPAKVRTNIVICDCSKTGKTAVEFCEELYTQGIWAQDTALHSVRFVTHCDVDRTGIERALPIIRQVASQSQKAKRMKTTAIVVRLLPVCLAAGAVHSRRLRVAQANTRPRTADAKGAPTIADAQAFLDDAEARLFDLGVTKHSAPTGCTQISSPTIPIRSLPTPTKS